MSKPLNILHLEDLPSDAELVARELRKGGIKGEIFVAANKNAFIKALKDFCPMLYFQIIPFLHLIRMRPLIS
jgi:hypothetical protein